MRDVIAAALKNPDFVLWWTTISTAKRKTILLDHMPDLKEDVLRVKGKSSDAEASCVPSPVIGTPARKKRARGNLFPRLHLGLLATNGSDDLVPTGGLQKSALCGCASETEARKRHGDVSCLLHEMWFRTATRENVRAALREDFAVAQRCFKEGTLTWSHPDDRIGTPVVAVLDRSTLAFEESVPVGGIAGASDSAHMLREIARAADDPKYLTTSGTMCSWLPSSAKRLGLCFSLQS